MTFQNSRGGNGEVKAKNYAIVVSNQQTHFLKRETQSNQGFVGQVIHVLSLSPQALINILNQKDVESDPENVAGYLRPFRLLMCLLDKPEIGRSTVGSPAVLQRVPGDCIVKPCICAQGPSS